jgi:hypothetical protein
LQPTLGKIHGDAPLPLQFRRGQGDATSQGNAKATFLSRTSHRRIAGGRL